MQVGKQYVLTECELRELFENLNRDMIQDTFDNKYFMEMLLREPSYLQKPLSEILNDCEVMMFDIPKDFHELTQTFLENWATFDMCREVENEFINNADLYFEIVIKRDSDGEAVILTKNQLLEYY